MKLKAYLFFLSLFVSAHSFAIEFYTLFDENCKTYDGLIVHSSDVSTFLLTSKGYVKEFNYDKIKGVLIYNFISSPIKGFHVRKASLSGLKKVSILSKEKEKVFYAFPVQFIDDLVVFVDLKGESHVHSLNSIYKIRPVPTLKQKVVFSYKPEPLDRSGYIQSCEKIGKSKSRSIGVKPNRILADRIRINQFFENLISGYESLSSFQEKTYVYARPMIYDQSTRFGLSRAGKNLEQSSFGLNANIFPFIEWSSGEPYKVQSFVQLGAMYNEYGEDLDGILGIRSEVKAHFFHASFVGNLSAMAAGKEFFSRTLEPNVKSTFVSSQQFDSGFNYLIYLGIDYGAFSGSFGFYYPLYIFQQEDSFREVLSTQAGYSLRFMYTQQKWRYFATALFKDEDSNSPTNENVLAISGGSTVPTLNSFSIKSQGLRGGADYDYDKKLKMGFNILFMRGEYSESSSAGGASIKYDRLGGTAYIRKDFGDYIGLGLRANYLKNNLRGNLEGVSLSNKDSNFGFNSEFSIIF